MITKLGLECVVRYYKWQLESPDNVYAIGAFNADKMLGFCFGGVFSMALGGFLVRNKGLIFTRLLIRPWLILHPTFTKKIVRGLILLLKFAKSKDSTTKSPDMNADTHFGILAIASDQTARGLGVGKRLMEYSEEYARNQDFKKMRLTVNPKNINAVHFYEHIGWIKEGDLLNWQGKMRKILIHE